MIRVNKLLSRYSYIVVNWPNINQNYGKSVRVQLTTLDFYCTHIVAK